MIVITDEGLKSKSAVALGCFDALHVGHMEIIRKTIKYARENECLAVVQLFEHGFIRQNEVNTLEQRLNILEKEGVDVVVVERLDEDFKKISYQNFVLKYINEKYNAKAVFVGFNYHFGHMAEGNAQRLEEECSKYGIEVFIQPKVSIHGTVSSTRVREMLSKGRVKDAALIMGRRYSLRGVVVKGKALGRDMGFPTANIEIPNGCAIPKQGVYLTIVKFDGNEYRGITNVGAKPTVFDEKQNIETNIIGYDGDLYGKEIELEFEKRIRDIVKFDSIDELRKQLERDKQLVLNERKG